MTVSYRIPWCYEANVRGHLAYLEGLVDELLAALREQGVLSDDGVDQLNERAREGLAEREFRLFKVGDAADWI